MRIEPKITVMAGLFLRLFKKFKKTVSQKIKNLNFQRVINSCVIFLLFSANAEELNTTLYLLEPKISFLRGSFSIIVEKNHKTIKNEKFDYSDGHNFTCKNNLVFGYCHL